MKKGGIEGISSERKYKAAQHSRIYCDYGFSDTWPGVISCPLNQPGHDFVNRQSPSPNCWTGLAADTTTIRVDPTNQCA